MTIDDERAAFIRDLLRVLTSLYSWAGAVVHGQTADGHDVIEVADGRRCWTEEFSAHRRSGAWRVRFSGGATFDKATEARVEDCLVAANHLTSELLETRIRDLLSGPPEDA